MMHIHLKTNILLLLLLTLSITAAAQGNRKFSVTKFALDQFDMTAQNEQYKKIDGNGSLYAIIKVSSNSDDNNFMEYRFNFGYMNHEVVQTKGRLWVYVQRNAKYVTISRKGFATVERYDLGTTIEAGRTYVMQLSAAPIETPMGGGTAVIPTVSGSDRTFKVKGVSFVMKAVAGGTFRMGADDSDAYNWEKPVHSVTISNYMIGETEVTQELWQAVMGSNPSNFKGAKRPVENVSWDDCQTFIQKLNELTGQRFRLPTEAEWEYAARGGNQSKGYKYAGSNSIDDVAWYTDNSSRTTHDVKTKAPNELGLYDMSGNVQEWCQDWEADYSSSAQTNPSGPSTGYLRVYRGGDWNLNARLCRVSFRYDSPPSYRYIDLGLRLAL